MQCSSHLKQIGIGVHNFHDTMQGVPPIIIGSAVPGPPGSNTDEYWSDAFKTASFWALIYPFVEQQGLYEYIARAGFGSPFSSAWWRGAYTGDRAMNDELRNQFGSVPIYRCPSRRGGGALITESELSTSDEPERGLRGPRGDYAVVVSFQRRNLPAISTSNMPFRYHFHSDLSHCVGFQDGPIRLALCEDLPNFGRWKPRDTFAWWSDGTSNQIVVGKKHIPYEYLNTCLLGNPGKVAVRFRQPILRTARATRWLDS